MDCTGKRFKWLTALYKTGRTQRNSPIWLCECTCGRRVEVPEFALRNGTGGCCGPCVDTMALLRSGGNFLGHTVQGITILASTGEKLRNSPLYLCRCNHCGEEFKAKFSDLRKGQVVACPECAKELPPPPDLGIR